jgi:hypothetical protein
MQASSPEACMTLTEFVENFYLKGRMSDAHILANFDWLALRGAARTEVVGCSFDRNWTMVLRELHVNEGKFAVTLR